MRKLYFFLLVLTAFVTFSCKSKSAFTDYSASAKLENALLWKVEGKDLAEPSYLYGTIHIIPKDDFFLPHGTEEAIKNTDKMFFEIDMNEMQNPAVMMSLMSKIMMEDNKTLKDLVSEEDYNIVSSHFEKMGLPMMMFERMKPMFLTVFASQDVLGGNTTSYEMEFMKLAEEQNKELGGLETIEFQLGVFDKIPLDAQAKMLVDGIKSASNGNDQMEKMFQVYKEQNLLELEKMVQKSGSGIEDYEDVLLVDRNKNWIPIIEKNIKNHPTFFAVGAGHLPGVNGVIKLLRKAGYKVSPVSNTK